MKRGRGLSTSKIALPTAGDGEPATRVPALPPPAFPSNPNSRPLAYDDDRMIREAECERITGLSRTTRWRLERQGKFPKRRQLSQNCVGWVLSEILAWRRALVGAASSHPFGI